MQKKKIFISGSIAYDYIMQYEGAFYDAIVKEHLEDFNVAFVGMNKKMHFGGCGTNIAYSLSLFGEKSVLYGSAGRDFGEYSEWLGSCGISVDMVGICKDEFTACAYVLTDKKERQIQIFSPGAMMNDSCDVSMEDFDFSQISYAILSPDFPKRTKRLAEILIEKGVPYFFDPGPNINIFSKDDLRYLLENAHGFIANDYEVKLLCKRLKIDADEIGGYVKIFIETLGSKGVKMSIDGEVVNIDAAAATLIADPTGCGDAFRSGFLAGLNKGLDPAIAAKMGALTATYSIEREGTQLHKFSVDEFSDRFKKSFNEDLKL